MLLDIYVNIYIWSCYSNNTIILQKTHQESCKTGCTLESPATTHMRLLTILLLAASDIGIPSSVKESAARFAMSTAPGLDWVNDRVSEWVSEWVRDIWWVDCDSNDSPMTGATLRPTPSTIICRASISASACCLTCIDNHAVQLLKYALTMFDRTHAHATCGLPASN